MRGILESYDSELAATEYSPQLNKRLKEAEDILQKTQSHYVEMEVSFHAFANTSHYILHSHCAALHFDCLFWDWVKAKDTESIFAKAKTVLCFILHVGTQIKTGENWKMNVRCTTVPPAGKNAPVAIRKVVEGWNKAHLFIQTWDSVAVVATAGRCLAQSLDRCLHL